MEIPFRVAQVPPLKVASAADVPPVALVTATLGDDGRVLAALPDLGYRGLVVEGMGGGHVPTEWLDPLRELATRMPVVLAARPRAGEVLYETYGYPGSEVGLLRAGLVRAGGLDGLKARLRLQLALMAGVDPADAFAATGTSSGPVTRPLEQRAGR